VDQQSSSVRLGYQSKTIRLPVHLGGTNLQDARVSLQMSEELGREPTGR